MSIYDLLLEIVDCFADELEGNAEMYATEELSFHIEAANKKLIQLGAKPLSVWMLSVCSPTSRRYMCQKW